MATEAQVEANRQNAQKSTGPKTAEGKAVVSQNALKHGLFAVQDVLSTENQAEFDLMREEMLAELAPIGVVESLLAQRAVSLAWRLKRAERMQNEAIEEIIEYKIAARLARESTRLRCEAQDIAKDQPAVQEDPLMMDRVAKHNWSNQRTLDHMFAYERRIENSLYKAMTHLRAAQRQRQRAAAEAQRCAQAQEEENSAEQTQSELTPEEQIAVAKRIYGDPLPQWVREKFKEIGITVDGGPQAPEPSELAEALQSQNGVSEPGATPSLLTV